MTQEINICGITRDLLPLSLDDMLSADSKALVEEHLKECSNCRTIRAKLERDAASRKKGKGRQAAVLSPIHQLTKEITIFTLGFLAAAAVLVFSLLGVEGIREALPMWRGFEVAGAKDLSLTDAESDIVLTAAPDVRNRILYYIYDIDGDEIDFYLSFGSEKQQYENLTRRRVLYVKDVDWKIGVDSIQKVDDGTYAWTAGTHTLDGKGGAACELSDMKTLHFPAETRNIYYVPDMDADVVEAFERCQHAQWEAVCDRPDAFSFVDDMYYYTTDDFDFSVFDHKIKLYP